MNFVHLKSVIYVFDYMYNICKLLKYTGTCMKIQTKKTHNPRSPPEEMSDTPHGDTNSGRTGSGVEANAIGC
jgi:hypothetical protein